MMNISGILIIIQFIMCHKSTCMLKGAVHDAHIYLNLHTPIGGILVLKKGVLRGMNHECIKVGTSMRVES